LAITTDNASNNNVFFEIIKTEFDQTGLNYQPIQHIHCLAHIINLAVQAFLVCLKTDDDITEDSSEEIHVISRLRTVITKIRTSPQRQEKFKIQCKAYGIGNLKELILDVKTRWNSTYSMIERALEFAEASILYYIILYYIILYLFI